MPDRTGDTIEEAQRRLEEKRRRFRGEQRELGGGVGAAVQQVATAATSTRVFIPEAPPECAICDDRGWVTIKDDGVGSSRRCECQARSRRDRRLAECEVPERYRGLALDSFTVSNPDPGVSSSLMAARAKAEGYLDRFLSMRADRSAPFRESGLLCQGPPGSGKTHLMCALLQDLIRRYNLRALFIDFTAFVSAVKATYDPGSQSSSSDLIGRAAGCEVLVIDELGAQKPTPHTLEVLYLVLNHRYNQRWPTLYTSNYYLGHNSGTFVADALDTRLSSLIVSRLHGTCHVVTFPNYDYRKQVQAHGTRP